MNQFFVKPILKSLIKNPPPFSVWKNLLLYKLAPNRLKPYHTPISMVIYITKRCNYKCEFCFTYDTLNKQDWKKFELTQESFVELLDSKFGKQALRIGLLGGEPFLNPLIFDFLKECEKRGKITTVVTNASMVNAPEKEQLLKHFPTMLGLSWYDNNQTKILELSEWLTKAKKDFWVQTVIGKPELELMTSKLELAKQYGIQNLIFSNYNPSFSGKVENVIFEDDPVYLALAPKVMSLAKSYGINLTLPQPIKRNPKLRNCNMPFSYVHVDSKGTMGACCFRAPDDSFGNIYQPETWNNNKNTELRQGFIDMSKPTISPCTYCENLSRDLYGF